MDNNVRWRQATTELAVRDVTAQQHDTRLIQAAARAPVIHGSDGGFAGKR
jgi:hypothetical protein